jgi:hypothetical protein
MRLKFLVAATLVAAAACSGDTTNPDCCLVPAPSLRVVNAFVTPVDVLVDGNVLIAGLAAGTVGTAKPASGAHTIEFRSTTGNGTSSRAVTTAAGSLNTIAVLRTSSGGVSTTVLDDTNSVVPAKATKVRVLHLAANAGTLQVFRTQPDYQTPVSWQFPFTYQSAPNSLSAPFYQSTPGTWEIHIWQTPADASGWASAPIKLIIPLVAGEKKTVVILDDPSGGVRTEIL